MLPGGCLVAQGHKFDVSGKLGKNLYGPLASRRGLGKVRHIEVNQLWIQEKVADGSNKLNNHKGACNGQSS